MGASQQTKVDNYTVLYDKLYIQALGNVKMYNEKATQQKYLSRKVELLPKLREGRIITINHPKIAKTFTLDITGRKNDDLNYNLYYFEYYQFTLKDMFKIRQQQKNYFEENELSRIAQDILEALVYLKENNISHGNIEAGTVFFDDKNQCCKIYDNELIWGQYSQITHIEKQNKVPMLSPESQLVYAKQQEKNYITQWKFHSDIFNLGLLILELGTLLESQDIYDVDDNFAIMDQKLNSMQSLFQNKYSQKLSQMVFRMLNYKPEPRLTCQDYLNQLKAPIFGSPQKSFQPQKAQIVPQIEVQKKLYFSPERSNIRVSLAQPQQYQSPIRSIQIQLSPLKYSSPVRLQQSQPQQFQSVITHQSFNQSHQGIIQSHLGISQSQQPISGQSFQLRTQVSPQRQSIGRQLSPRNIYNNNVQMFQGSTNVTSQLQYQTRVPQNQQVFQSPPQIQYYQSQAFQKLASYPEVRGRQLLQGNQGGYYPYQNSQTNAFQSPFKLSNAQYQRK